MLLFIQENKGLKGRSESLSAESMMQGISETMLFGNKIRKMPVVSIFLNSSLCDCMDSLYSKQPQY